MNCRDIENALNLLKVDSLGRIRNKSKVINEIHSMHINKIDSDFMDVRVEIAKGSYSLSPREIDEILYKKQVSQ